MMQWNCLQCACDPSNPAVAPSWCRPLTMVTTKLDLHLHLASATHFTSRSREAPLLNENFPPVSRTRLIL
jgi:hypothetical protein